MCLLAKEIKYSLEHNPLLSQTYGSSVSVPHISPDHPLGPELWHDSPDSGSPSAQKFVTRGLLVFLFQVHPEVSLMAPVNTYLSPQSVNMSGKHYDSIPYHSGRKSEKDNHEATTRTCKKILYKLYVLDLVIKSSI